MSEIIQCMSCGYKGMVREENRTETITHDGESLTLTGLAGWFCPSCHDGWFDDADQVRYAKAGDELIHRARAKNCAASARSWGSPRRKQPPFSAAA